MQARALSVSDLNEYVRRSLAADPMLQDVTLRGEISNFKRHTSGHLYFSLKDENSRIACVMFRQYAQMLRFYPQDGMMVLLSGSVGLYTASGSYQFYGQAMQKDGVGALYEKFLALRDKLQKEGLFDAARKKPLPLLPRAVGVVTSATGAVISDILTVTRRRFENMPVILRPSLVQGEGAAEDLKSGLFEIAALDNVDVIIIGRGGGSLEDLWAFNDEALVRAIAACEKPVISAVGHETDITLADFAADMRAPTPSAAAELAVPIKKDLKDRVDATLQALHVDLQQKMTQNASRINELTGRLQNNNPVQRIALAISHQGALADRLRAAAVLGFQQLSAAAETALARLKYAGPALTLERGYTIALAGGHPVTRAKDAPEEMSILFLDGSVRVKKLDTTLNDKEKKS
ncbi:MAG: exodeoxyribonuclease VII large subunit [Eubacteriales bacterium]|nr:exodeoxyribonuclease VII large subunit [Eubacteriales bacterium]